MPELDLSQSLLPPDYPDVTLRHVALLLATWMLARIAEVVHNLLQATQCSEAKGDAASLPVQQGEPTLKAGSSVPKQSNGYSGVHAWTSMEARNFKVRSAPRLQCYHQPPPHCYDGCDGCLPSLPLRMLSPLLLLSRQVRCGPNYPKYGKKAPSGAALGTVEAMDIFLTQRRISHSLALGHIALPPATPGWSEVYPEFLVITQVSRKQEVPAVGSL